MPSRNRRDPDYDLVRSRAFDYILGRGKLTHREMDEALEAGRAELRYDRTVGFAALEELHATPETLPKPNATDREIGNWLCPTCSEFYAPVGQRCKRCTASIEDDRMRQDAAGVL